MSKKPSKRLQKLLTSNNLTLFQAFRKTDKELLSMNTFGKKALTELREIQWGLTKT